MHAVVDVVSNFDDRLIGGLPIKQGTVTLIGAAKAVEMYRVLGLGAACSGGPAANTVVNAATVSTHKAFVGRVKDDQLGTVCTHEIRAVDMLFDSPPASDGAETTARLRTVTPTMPTAPCTST